MVGNMCWAHTAQESCSESRHTGQTQKNKEASMFLKLKVLSSEDMHCRYHHIIRKGKTWPFKRKLMEATNTVVL